MFNMLRHMFRRIDASGVCVYLHAEVTYMFIERHKNVLLSIRSAKLHTSLA